MKFAISAAILGTAFSLACAAPATADIITYETVCSSSQNSSESPSGTYVDPHGQKWAGHHQNGTVPQSLVSGSTSTTCVQVEVVDNG